MLKAFQFYGGTREKSLIKCWDLDDDRMQNKERAAGLIRYSHMEGDMEKVIFNVFETPWQKEIKTMWMSIAGMDWKNHM